jgi:hypothetical protein
MNATVLALLDQMEDLIACAPALPVAGRIIVDRTRLLGLIDAMRAEATQFADEPARGTNGRSP